MAFLLAHAYRETQKYTRGLQFYREQQQQQKKRSKKQQEKSFVFQFAAIWKKNARFQCQICCVNTDNSEK